MKIKPYFFPSNSTYRREMFLPIQDLVNAMRRAGDSLNIYRILKLEVRSIVFLFKHLHPESILKLDHTELQDLYRLLHIFLVSKCFTSQSILDSCFNDLPIRSAWAGAGVTEEQFHINIFKNCSKNIKNGTHSTAARIYSNTCNSCLFSW